MKFIFLAMLLVSSESAFLCEIKKMELAGIGCKITNITINYQPVKIEMSKYSPQLSPADMEWIKVVDSTFLRSPKPLLDIFTNATRVIIVNAFGWTTLDKPIFNEITEMIAIRDTSLKVIGEKAFRGLSQLTRLDLSDSAIKTIHKSAFADLSALTRIDLSFNKIESLDNEVFENNISLLNISLSHNEIESLSVDLFARNLELQRLDLGYNKVSQIEEGFGANLAELQFLGLSSNVCVDKILIEDDVYDLKSFLGECYTNYENNQSSVINDE